MVIGPTVPKDSDANSTDGFFNVPNRVGDEAFLNMCRVLNSVQYFCTYCIVSKPGNSCPMYLYIAGGAGVWEEHRYKSHI